MTDFGGAGGSTTRSMIIASAGPGSTIRRFFMALGSTNVGDRITSISRRRRRVTTASSSSSFCVSSMRYPYCCSSNCCQAVNRSTTTRKTLKPTERHISRWRSRSTSRTIGLFRTSFLIAHSNDSLMSIPRRAGNCQLSSSKFQVGTYLLVDTWDLHLLHGPQLGTAGAGIALDFGRCRDHRSFGPDRDPPLGLQRAERVLHDPILERVERDHRHAAAVVETVHGPPEKAVEPFKFPVHPDADRLKRARRRIDPRIPLARNRPADHVREPARRGDRRLGSRRQNRPCHPPRVPFLAKRVDHVRQRLLVSRRHHFRRGTPRG